MDSRSTLAIVWFLACTAACLWLVWRRAALVIPICLAASLSVLWGLGPLWSGGCAAACLLVVAGLRLADRPNGVANKAWLRQDMGALLAVVAVATVVRLVPTLLLVHTNIYDLDSYRIVARVLRAGGDVYLAPDAAGRYPYLPLQLIVIAFADRVSESLGLPFNLLIRLPALVADVSIVVVIAVVLERTGACRERVRLVSLAYAVNPISTIVIAAGAQFDSIPLVLLLGACALRSLARPTLLRVGLSALLLGVAIADKTWPLLLLPVLVVPGLRPRELVSYVALALAVPLAAAFIYSAQWGTPLGTVLRTPLEYSGVPGRYGLSGLTNFGTRLFPALAPLWSATSEYGRLLLLAGLVVVFLWTYSWPLWQRALAITLTFYVLMPGFGLQYLSWIIPIALLSGAPSGLKHYVTWGVFALLIMYWLEISPALRADIDLNRAYQVTTLPVWLVSVGWWLSHLRHRHARSSTGADVPVPGVLLQSWRQ